MGEVHIDNETRADLGFLNACEQGDLEKIRAFGTAGILPTSLDNPIRRAAVNGHREAAHILVKELGVNPNNAVSEHMRTGLMEIAEQGLKDAVDIMLDIGADPTFTNGRTASQYAKDNGHTELAEILQEAEIKWKSEHSQKIDVPKAKRTTVKTAKFKT